MPFLTIIESPYAGEVQRNLAYLKRCILHSLKQGEIPFASHGFYPRYLDDSDPLERQQGIELGYSFWNGAIEVAFYIDYGFSPGMEQALERVSRVRNWRNDNILTSLRRIGENP